MAKQSTASTRPTDPLADVPESEREGVRQINRELERLRAANWGESSILEKLAASANALAWPWWCEIYADEYAALTQARAELFA